VLRLVIPTLIASIFPACLPAFDDVEEPPIQEPPVEPPPDPVTRVTVTVRDGGAPVPGVSIVFQAPGDDHVLADVVTDATGTAVAEMPDGGSVTAIRSAIVGDETTVTAYTLAGVKPGDSLVIGNPVAPLGTPVTVTLQLPAAGQFAVVSPCGIANGGPQLSIQLSGCGTDTDFFAFGQAGAFLARRAIAPTIDLTTETLRANRDTTLTATNVPPATPLTLEKKLLSGDYTLFRSGARSGAQVTARVPDPGTATADQLVIARLENPRRQDVAARAAYTSGDATIDVGAALIPFVDPATFDGRTVTWTQDGAGTPDLAVVTLVDGTLTRVVAGPITGPMLALPSFARARGVDVGPDALVEHSTVKVTGGYDAIRARVLAVDSLVEAAPANSTIAVATAN
jgi:hypothetical protein